MMGKLLTPTQFFYALHSSLKSDIQIKENDYEASNKYLPELL